MAVTKQIQMKYSHTIVKKDLEDKKHGKIKI